MTASDHPSVWECYFDTSPDFDGFPRLTQVWVNTSFPVDMPAWYVKAEQWEQTCLPKKEDEG